MIHRKMILLVFKNLGRYRSENNYFDSSTKLFLDLAKFLDKISKIVLFTYIMLFSFICGDR